MKSPGRFLCRRYDEDDARPDHAEVWFRTCGQDCFTMVHLALERASQEEFDEPEICCYREFVQRAYKL